jgi:hypothetical protein
MGWIHLAQDGGNEGRFVDTVMNPRVPENAKNFLIIRGTVQFFRTLIQVLS